jgi:FG-GAP-like repeat
MRNGRIGVLAVTLVVACFEENVPLDATSGMDGTTAQTATSAPDPTTTATGPSTDTEPPPTTGTTTSTSVDDTATDVDSSSGEPIPLRCDDQVAAPGELCFGDTTVFMANDDTFCARIGDVSGTADADVVHLIPDQVVVRVGDGEGNMGTAVYDASVVAERIELADMDEDGELDVVVAETAGMLRLLHGSGAGSFSSVAQAPIGSNTRALVVGDLDGDGDLDAVVGSGAMLYPVLGDGGGNLSPAPSVSTIGQVMGLALADVDDDGTADLVLTVEEGVAVCRGLGDGTFLAQEPTPGQQPGARGVAAGDFDGDGAIDVAYVSQATDSLGVLLGDGAGGFAAEVAVATGGSPDVLLAEDLDNDGRLDLVVAHQGETTLRIFVVEPGVGPVEGLQVPLSGPVSALHSGDLNGDGVPDLAATSAGTPIVTLVLSTP